MGQRSIKLHLKTTSAIRSPVAESSEAALEQITFYILMHDHSYRHTCKLGCTKKVPKIKCVPGPDI